MDNRQTLHTTETFFELLLAAYKGGEMVRLLIDKEGISRMEGFIRKMDIVNPLCTVELDNGSTVATTQIVAVNGIFRPEYGEC